MFTACPHCQFLVSRDPRPGAAPADCPRCGKPTSKADDAPAAAPSLATLLHAAPAASAPATTPAIDGQVDASHAMPSEAPALSGRADAAEEHAAPAEEVAPDSAVATSDTPSPDVPTAASNEAAASLPLLVRKTTGPRFLQRARTTPVHTRRARLQWAVAAALSLLLCIQVVVADRARLATQSGWRPVVLGLCAVFRCDVPTWREPTAFTMLSRDVRPLPDAPGTLQAQATFRNEARWPQAWPVILLTLKDADGRTLGARALQPADYLPADQALTSIEPGQSAQMAVRIREPSANVVAFSFDFR